MLKGNEVLGRIRCYTTCLTAVISFHTRNLLCKVARYSPAREIRVEAFRRPRCGGKWHAGRASFSRINGKTHYLWRAVDQDGNVLDSLVQSRRNKKTRRFFRKLLRGL